MRLTIYRLSAATALVITVVALVMAIRDGDSPWIVGMAGAAIMCLVLLARTR